MNSPTGSSGYLSSPVTISESPVGFPGLSAVITSVTCSGRRNYIWDTACGLTQNTLNTLFLKKRKSFQIIIIN